MLRDTLTGVVSMCTTERIRLAMYRLFLISLLLARLASSQHSHTGDQSLDKEVSKHLEDFDLEFPSIDDYKEAATSFFQQMTAVGYGNASVVVFGGMSLWNYFPKFRYTPDIDIQINEPDESRLQVILEKMATNSGGKLSWENDKDLLFWTVESGWKIFMDIGYVPFGKMYGIEMAGSASPAAAVTSLDSIPFANPDEMFVIKLCASARRLSVKKMWQDVADAEFIAESVHRLHIVGNPIDKAYECLAEFLPKSQYTEEWWYDKLGLFNRSCTYLDLFIFNPS